MLGILALFLSTALFVWFVYIAVWAISVYRK